LSDCIIAKYCDKAAQDQASHFRMVLFEAGI